MASKRRAAEPSAADLIEQLNTSPGRRRTDNPLVVGTIVICLGITALASIIQITATLWAGSQLRAQMEQQQKRDEGLATRRDFLTKSAEAQTMVLRRLCLNVARDDKEKAECLTAAPAPPTTSSRPLKEGR